MNFLKHTDLPDGLIVAGYALVTTGTAAIYWPAGVVVAGLLCFCFAVLIERAKKAGQ